jgi:hypothetical protein
LATPYGILKVFEWGPEGGEKVLLLHGIGTPCLALEALATTLVTNGYRVMLFGRLIYRLCLGFAIVENGMRCCSQTYQNRRCALYLLVDAG